MRDEYDRETVDRLARAVLAGRALNEDAGLDARAELAQFDVVARAFHDSSRRGRRGRRRQEPLAFGVEGIMAAVTTLVLAITVDVLSQLAQDQTRRTATRVTSWTRRVLLRRPEPTTDPEPTADPTATAEPDSATDPTATAEPDQAAGPPNQAAEPPNGQAPLTPEQMRTIHRIARHHAHRMRVPEETAEAIANGIVAELAMTPTAREPLADGEPRGDRDAR
ncbi:hypothetical protein [Streptomyces ipomoeae]|uniref:hypothetical protein n=1 Tax=Streptomyces ipomoeae TaxID=103232 RepID=UPI001146E1C4|nr:hypothetical protein [Streptomyces ipomoeae]MDX2935304.1 hypothetical protein [Streptomyces ipomoeae]TQE15048.1 hypothetical protein SipoB123_45255 [Streptomyces ipomoeae]